MNRWLALVLAYFFLALAIIGAFLPIMPTVPFLILSAWFAARGSERLHGWLYAHPHLGKLLIDWEREGAVSRSGKILSATALTGSWIIMYYRFDNIWLLAGIGALFIGITVYMVTRPEPSNGIQSDPRSVDTKTETETESGDPNPFD